MVMMKMEIIKTSKGKDMFFHQVYSYVKKPVRVGYAGSAQVRDRKVAREL